jgi:hypothetical protein
MNPASKALLLASRTFANAPAHLSLCAAACIIIYALTRYPGAVLNSSGVSNGRRVGCCGFRCYATRFPVTMNLVQDALALLLYRITCNSCHKG